MLLELIKDENDKPIGWKLIPENTSDEGKLATVRNLQYFGLNDTEIQYTGRKGKDVVTELSWKQKKHNIN